METALERLLVHRTELNATQPRIANVRASKTYIVYHKANNKLRRNVILIQITLLVIHCKNQSHARDQ